MELTRILIDRDEFIKECDKLYRDPPFVHPGTTWDRGLLLAVSTALAQEPVNVVSVEEYNELKDRYKKLLETADILDKALRQYQQKYGDIEEQTVEEYIKKSDARRAILKAYPSAIYCIDNIRAVKTAEIQLGRWECWAGNLLCCSVCGYEYSDYIECTNYCGNCGAKMSLEG